jgi:5-methylcytosine-specific restriction enzyme A
VKLQSLKPRLATLNTARVTTLAHNPYSTPRMRGRKYMDRKERWLQQHPFCNDCMAEGRKNAIDPEVDHEIPLWKGGMDDESNFTTRCKEHHAAKTAREAAERGGMGPAA